MDEVDRIYSANELDVFELTQGGLMATAFGSLEAIAARVGSLPLRHQPGTLWDYALGHQIAGRCAEVAMGRTLTSIIQTEIFDPLGMKDAAWSESPARCCGRRGPTRSLKS